MCLLLVCLCVVLAFQFGQDPVSATQCGTVNTVIPLVVNGNRIQRGAWPFLVAVYEVSESKFFCGGTLISNKHVLTAAHCVHGKYSPKELTPKDITVHLGAYNLKEMNERTAVQRNVTQIYVHPDWEVYRDEYDADLAILLLSDTVEFSNFIRPVCLPSEDDIFDNASGYVVGWGLTENKTAYHKEYPNVGATNALNASYCYPTDKIISAFSSPRTFCGGGGKGSPNEGDSGGGFFVLSRSAWVQYGIVSAIRPHSDGHIDENSFAIYQNVKLYKNWIVETAISSGGGVMTVGKGTNIKLESEEMNFVAKIYDRKDNNNKFFCSGTLISSRHVVTSAHCIQGKYTLHEIEAHEIIVHVEAFNLTTNSDIFALKSIAEVQRNVSEIYVHPDWDVWDEKYDADLAILLLSDNVADEIFRPVCMPADDVVVDADVMDDIRGTAITRRLPNDYRVFPRPIIINTLRNSHCFTENNMIAAFTSKRTFCGRGEKEGINRGDGGGGLFIHSGSTWVLYGMMSAVLANSTGYFDQKSMILFNNVKLYKPWIIETIDQSRNAVLPMCEAHEIDDIKINFYCDYTDYDPYTCVLRDVDVSYEHLDVAAFMGSHLSGKTAEDVEEIRFYDGRMLHIPDKIGIFFPNLKYFSVRSKMSLKLLRPSNFRNSEYLVDVEIDANDIHTLHKETLWDLPNLERFSLTYNNIAILHKSTFGRNPKLREVNLRSNKLEFLHRNLFASNLLLETVNFDDNALSVIETTFTNIKSISLLHNMCINAMFDETDHKYRRNFIRNFTKFQSLLINCSSHKP